MTRFELALNARPPFKDCRKCGLPYRAGRFPIRISKSSGTALKDVLRRPAANMAWSATSIPLPLYRSPASRNVTKFTNALEGWEGPASGEYGNSEGKALGCMGRKQKAVHTLCAASCDSDWRRPSFVRRGSFVRE